MRRCPAATGWSATGFQDDQRHSFADVAGHPDEGTGIGDGLEVGEDNVGTGVLAPVQQEVGHADVGGVTD